MKIELTEAGPDMALGPHKSELWVRVLSPAPLGPDDWAKVTPRLSEAELAEVERFQKSFIKFYGDLRDEGLNDEDPDEAGFEQWWIFPAKITKG